MKTRHPLFDFSRRREYLSFLEVWWDDLSNTEYTDPPKHRSTTNNSGRRLISKPQYVKTEAQAH